MKVTFPAMRGSIGKRDYYVAMIKLNLIPKIFSFHEWAELPELPPEQRAQRVLQRARVPEITQYILDNEDGYLFSSLTASFDGEPSFKPSTESNEMGLLELSLESQFVINDGQHRMAAIIEAMKQNPTLRNETISVVFFPFENLDRMQQMFSDLNRTVRVTSKSLNILYDHRDLLAQIVLEAAEKVPVFRNMVDKDRVSLPLRSPKLFTLSAIYDATQQLVGEVAHESQYDEKAKITLDYWETVGANIPQWKQVLDGYLRPSELRAEYVNSHAVVLWGLGAMGKLLLQEYPTEWISRLQDLSKIDWRRINKEWDGICMQGSEIVNRRQSKNNTATFLKNKMGLPLSPSEEKFLKPVQLENLSTGGKLGKEEFPNLLTNGSKDPEKGPKTKLRVSFINSGKVIEESYAADTFVLAIKEMGLGKVEALGLTQQALPLIDTKKDREHSQRQLDGKYICVHSSTDRKKKILETIGSRLGVGLKIEIIH